MGKKQAEARISKTEQQLLDGIELIKAHPLFGQLSIRHRMTSKNEYGKETAAKVSEYQVILNKDCNRTPQEWAYIIAHCMLHLSFGHFDAERMPGYFTTDSKGANRYVVECDFGLWNMACDIYISKFLADVKFGTPPIGSVDLTRYGNAASELKIYDLLVRNHTQPSENVFGTAGIGIPDLIEPSAPLTYSNNRKNEYVSRFAYALADSVRTVINTAGNQTVTRPQTITERAAAWFINHYPLLGGLATGFKIVDTREGNINDVEIAAVDVTKGEIYVNRAAGLNFDEWKFVLAHEYLHAGLQHHARRQGRDPYLWNVACDFVINGWLKEMQVGQMPAVGLLYDETLKNRSGEEIYDLLLENFRKNAKLETFRGYGKGDVIQDGYSGNLSEPTTLDEFCKNALRNGLEYHTADRGLIPAGLIEEIRALSMPPIPWDVQLAEWFDLHFAPLEKHRTYARPSRRQSSTPDIPRPSLAPADIPENSRTYGVVIDTSGSMSAKMIGIALGATASYSVSKDVPFVRVVFCDADAYDAGYLAPCEIAGRVRVQGRGGTVLQPAVDLLEQAKDFPKSAPILIITDGYIERDLHVSHEHAFLLPEGNRLPFRTAGKVFYFK